MTIQKYHIGEDGQPRVCRATERPCPLGGHFTDLQEAERFSSHVSELEFMKQEKIEVKKFGNSYIQSIDNIPLIASFTKHDGSNKLLVTKGLTQKMEKLNRKLYNLEKYQAKEKYRKTSGNKNFKEFLSEYKKTDPSYLITKEAKVQFSQEWSEVIQQRKQAKQIVKDLDIQQENGCFSAASASFYFAANTKEDLEKYKKYIEDKGYEMDIRPNTDIPPCQSVLLRIADHLPKEVLKANFNKNGEINIWEHTNASILIKYKRVKRQLKERELTKIIKEDADNPIWENI